MICARRATCRGTSVTKCCAQRNCNMRAEDVIRIRLMIEAAQSAMQFVANRQRADLATDRMLQFALVRAIEIVGEAVNKVSDETRSTNTGIPWKAIIGRRNRLVHAYFEVDAEILWLVALEHVLRHDGAISEVRVLGDVDSTSKA